MQLACRVGGAGHTSLVLNTALFELLLTVQQCTGPRRALSCSKRRRQGSLGVLLHVGSQGPYHQWSVPDRAYLSSSIVQQQHRPMWPVLWRCIAHDCLDLVALTTRPSVCFDSLAVSCIVGLALGQSLCAAVAAARACNTTLAASIISGSRMIASEQETVMWL